VWLQCYLLPVLCDYNYLLCVLHDYNYLLYVLCAYYCLLYDWRVFSMLGVFAVFVNRTLMHVLALHLYIH